MNKKSLLQSLKVIILGALLSIGIAFAQTWTPPSSTPPVPNADAPINVGGTKQIKAGPLVIGTNYLNALKGGGSADFSGYDLKTSVGIFKDIVTDDLSSNTIGIYQATVGALGHSASIPQPVCADKGGKLVLCGAPPPTVTCGSADGETFTTAPTTNLCSDGSTPTVSGGANGPWSWTCGAASCSATKTVVPTGSFPAGNLPWTPGNYTFAVPAGVTEIIVEVQGAGGGGGGGGAGSSGSSGKGGAGGGGGGYIKAKITNVGGANCAVSIGGGSAGGGGGSAAGTGKKGDNGVGSGSNSSVSCTGSKSVTAYGGDPGSGGACGHNSCSVFATSGGGGGSYTTSGVGITTIASSSGITGEALASTEGGKGGRSFLSPPDVSTGGLTSGAWGTGGVRGAGGGAGAAGRDSSDQGGQGGAGGNGYGLITY